MNGKSSDKNHKIISRTFILACFFCNHISTNIYVFKYLYNEDFVI